MARGRMISKSLSTSEKFGGLVTLGDLAEFVQLLYPLLVVHSDDFGRLQGDPYTVKHVCLPASPRSLDEFGRALRKLEGAGLIRWYVANDQKCYIQITNFDRHQLGLHKRTASHFPAIPEESLEKTCDPGISGNFPVKRTKEKGTKENPPLSPPHRPRRPKAENSVCPHAPRCQTRHACIERSLVEARQEKEQV